MKAFICFILGLGIGVEIFFFAKDYADKNDLAFIPKSVVLSSQTKLIETKTPVVSVSPTISELFSVSPSITPTESPNPTPKIKIMTTNTLTKKPTPTPSIYFSPTSISPSITPIISIIASPSVTTTVSIAPTPTKTISLTYTTAEIYALYDRFGGQYGVNPNVLRYIAKCESNFNPLSVSRNGLYAGLYQFSSGTWTTYRRLIGEDINPDLRLNPEEAIQTAAYVVSIGRIAIWPNCQP